MMFIIKNWIWRIPCIALWVSLGGLGVWSGEVHGNVFNNWNSGSWGSVSQSFMFDFHSVTRSRFYEYGDLIYQYNGSSQRGEEVIGQDYGFESRTAYYYRYVTVLFLYKYETRLVKYFNSLEIESPTRRQTRGVHIVMPQIYLTYEPLRVGLSYYSETSKDNAFVDEQTWSLRGDSTLSFHVQLYFAKIPFTPLGLTTIYEFGFRPGAASSDIPENNFQRIGFNMDVYFTHYSQFKLGFTYATSSEDVVLQNADVVNSTDASNRNYEISQDSRSRYYLDYIFIYRFTDMVSVNMMMGQMVYANFESPAYRFKVGITYHYGQ